MVANAQFPGQQPPPNDMCARAIEIVGGDRLGGHTNADATSGLDYERPATVETTCIQTIENDVWFKFKAVAGVQMYEVQIIAGFCTTPAGLQALLIEADGCSAAHFVYRGCSNKINTDTIKLFLDAPKPGQNYFIWIDGYDGTACEFEVALVPRVAKQPADYQFMRFDYMLDEPTVQREDLAISFANNAATLQWSADQREGNSLFIIELLPELVDVDAESRYARVVGFVPARTLVGQGLQHYTFTDYITPYNQGKAYRYRVVLVDEDGTRSVSQPMVTQAKLVESYEVREVKAAPEAGKYIVHYINRKKGQRFDVSVEDANGLVVKKMVLDNQPVQDGDITIDMQAFAPGEYFFVMRTHRDSFRRAFIHIAK
jgi:hypothetical protein